MRIAIASIAAVLASLAVQLPVFAGEAAQKPPLEGLLFRNGESLVARVMELAGPRLKLELKDGKKLEIGASEFEPAQIYQIRVRGFKDESVKERHELADFCVKNGLHAFAAREYERIGKMNPELADVVRIWLEKLELGEAQKLYASAWDSLAARDWKGAREKFASIIEKHATDPLAKRAQAFLPYAVKMSHLGSESLVDGLEAQAQKLVIFAEKKADEAKGLEKAALDFMKAGNITKARDTIEESEKSFSVARNILKALHDEFQTGEAGAFLKERLKVLERRMVEFYVTAAEFYIELKSWKKAKDKTERGLALDKESKRLRSLAELINKAQ